ncbi:MAG: DUF6465 family protein [Ruminococcus sp.]
MAKKKAVKAVEEAVKAVETKVEEKAAAKAAKAEEKAAEKAAKAPAKKAAPKKTAPKKPEAVEKAVAAAAPAAPAAPAEKVDFFVEYGGVQVAAKEVVKNIKSTIGKDAKEIAVYLKPEESKAYFVADGESGSMDVYFC